MSDTNRHNQDDVTPTAEKEDLANAPDSGEMTMTHEPTETETDEHHLPRGGDEATVASSNKSNQSRSNKPKPWQKRVVKLLITNNNKRSDDVIVNEMTKVLSSLQTNLPNNVSIITNTGRPYERGSGTTDELMKQYKVYQKAKGKARTQHWILTDIQSNLSLKEIRDNTFIQNSLNDNNCKLSDYRWESSEGDVVSLGFFLGPTPRAIMTATMAEEASKYLERWGNVQKAKQATFKVAVTTVVCTTKAGTKLGAQAFEVQTLRKYQEQLTKQLDRAASFSAKNKAPVQFIFYETRRREPNIFNMAIQKQAKIVDFTRIVTIQGISRNEMYYVENILPAIHPSIVRTAPTIDTDTRDSEGKVIGRWHVLTNRDNFVQCAKKLEERLASVTAQAREQYSIGDLPPTVPIAVLSNFPGKREYTGRGSRSVRTQGSRDSFMTYESSLASSLTGSWGDDYFYGEPSSPEQTENEESHGKEASKVPSVIGGQSVTAGSTKSSVTTFNITDTVPQTKTMPPAAAWTDPGVTKNLFGGGGGYHARESYGYGPPPASNPGPTQQEDMEALRTMLFSMQQQVSSLTTLMETFMRHQISTSGLQQQDYYSPVRKKQNTGGTSTAGADREQEQEEANEDLAMKVVQEEAGGRDSTDPQTKPPDPNEGRY